ncbi:hypothetical protein ABTE76_19195, partial [Acinetobacter baumannii]
GSSYQRISASVDMLQICGYFMLPEPRRIVWERKRSDSNVGRSGKPICSSRSVLWAIRRALAYLMGY